MPLSNEQENYIKIAFLIVDVITCTLQCLLDWYISQKGLTLYKLLDNCRQTIFHLYSCKPCNNSCKCRTQAPILTKSQLSNLFDIPKNTNVNEYSNFSQCPVISKICTSDLDITLLRILLRTCCTDLFWSKCLPQRKPLSEFLSENKHDLYHFYWFNQRCCKCSKTYVYPSDHRVLSQSQFKTLFPIIGKTRCKYGNSDCIVCMSEPSISISPNNLGETLISAIFDCVCPLTKTINKMVKLRNELYGHIGEAKFTENEFKKYWTEITEVIFIVSQESNNSEYMLKKIRDVETISITRDMYLETLTRIQTELQTEAKLEKCLAKIETVTEETGIKVDHMEKKLDNKIDRLEKKIDNVLVEVSHESRKVQGSLYTEDERSITSCSPCKYRRQHTTATKMCLECEEALCSECGTSHISNKKLRDHHVVSMDDHIKLGEYNHSSTCKFHLKTLHFYCPTHCSPLCVVCIQQDHANCSPPKDLSEVTKTLVFR